MPETFNFLIAGCGYVGRSLADRLLDQGHTVWALRRSLMPKEPGIRWLQADLAVPESLAGLPPDLDGIFYTAAASRARGDDPFVIYEQGPRNLIQALVEQDITPHRFLFTSSSGVYGQTDGGWVDESSPCTPQLPAGQAMLAGERVLAKAPWPTVALRYSGIYGPARTRMLRIATESPVVLATQDLVYLNQVHQADCVGALQHAWALPDPKPLYLVSDEQPATRFEVLSWLARRAGVALPTIDPSLEPPPRLRGNKRVDGSLFRKSGYTFRFPSFRDGYAALMDQGSARKH